MELQPGSHLVGNSSDLFPTKGGLKIRFRTVLASAFVLGHYAIANATPLPSKLAVATYASRLLNENYSANSPGAEILVARGEEVLFQGTRGLSDVKRGKPIAPDDLFAIASLTKQFIAVSILRLVETG